MQTHLYDLKIFALTLITAWIVIIMGFLVWEIFTEKRYAVEFARTEAIGSYNKDLAYRRWATLHGGVYVPETKETPASPYLANVKERDISTPSGRRLTLVNPAYMTRQVHELSQRQYGVKGHITSLNLIRPENKPDSWENKALQAFESGKKEVSSVDSIEGKDYFRLMRPMFVEEGCLKCHGYQDYQVGDIRGGVSVSVPLAPYYAIASKKISKTIFGHFTILVLGLLGLGGAFFVINKSSRERIVAESRFQRAMDASKDGIFDWDLETKKIYYSPGWKRMLGYAPDELPDEFSIWETLTNSEDVKASWVMINEVIDGKLDRFEKEIKMRHKDGHWVDILSRANLYKDEQSGSVRVVGTHVDISERKQMESGLEILIKTPEAKHRTHFREWLLSAVYHKKRFASGALDVFLEFISGPLGQSSLFQHQVGHYDYKHTFEIANRLSELSAIPVQILWGENDTWQNFEWAYKLNSAIPGSVVHLIPKCGHFAMEDQPEEISRRLISFSSNSID